MNRQRRIPVLPCRPCGTPARCRMEEVVWTAGSPVATMCIDPDRFRDRMAGGTTPMKLVRPVLAGLLAFAVAALPAAGGVALHADIATAQQGSSSEASSNPWPVAAAGAMDDCAGHTKSPCPDNKGCGASLFCALKCFGFSTVEISAAIFPKTVAENSSPRAESVAHSEAGTPPFRPPRV